MTVPPTPTVIVLGLNAADRNACTGTRAADQPLPPGMRPVPARELDAIAAHALKRRYKPPSTPARQPSPYHYPHQASVTIPIVPNFPRLRSIRLL